MCIMVGITDIYYIFLINIAKGYYFATTVYQSISAVEVDILQHCISWHENMFCNYVILII